MGEKPARRVSRIIQLQPCQKQADSMQNKGQLQHFMIEPTCQMTNNKIVKPTQTNDLVPVGDEADVVWFDLNGVH